MSENRKNWKKSKATTDALTKILVYLKMVKCPAIRKMIIQGTELKSTIIGDGLCWLVSHKLVEKVKLRYKNGRYNKDMWYYFVPDLNKNTKRFK